MTISVTTPNGSIIFHVNMLGGLENEKSGNLILIHKGGVEKIYPAGTWVRFTAEKSLDIPKRL